MKRIRSRYAPSPTGYLHIGGARTALFAYLYAKHFNGDFIVRIEDTDVSRNVEGGEESQLENLAWLGIVPDESPQNPNEKYGPYRQSEKLDRYNKLIDKMVSEESAYKAYDTSEEILAQKEEQEKNKIASFRYDRNWLVISDEEKARRDAAGEYTIRVALPKDKYYSWNDIVRGKISVNTSDIGDFVIRKNDGYPTYNFAVVVDDHDMEITHVLRGEEHTTNTPKQMAIYDLLGWEWPEFGHLTIITNMDGKKLSKRDTHLKQFISDYKKDGYAHKAVFNFLTLLGWTHPQAKEVMTHEEIIESFDPARLSKSPSKFDIKKMQWFSKMFIKNQNNNSVAKGILYTCEEYGWDKQTDAFKFLSEKIGKGDDWLDLFLETYKQNAFTFSILNDSFKIYEDHSVNPSDKSEVIKTFAEELNSVEFTVENIQNAINATKDKTGAKGKDLFMPIRAVTTYQEHGPELAKSIFLFGKETILERLK